MSLGISYEFVIISIITLIAVELKMYALWMGVLIGFFLHLCGHIGSTFIKRGYVPSLLTSIIGVIYTLVVVEEQTKTIKLDLIDVFFWTVVAIVLIVVNLQIVIKIIESFDNWFTNWSKA